MFGPSRSMQRAPVAIRFSIESAISSPSILGYHSFGSSYEAMSVAARLSLASMISKRSMAFRVMAGVVMKLPTTGGRTVL